MLTDDTTTKFRAALREQSSDAVASPSMMDDVIGLAALEARHREMTAEQLVLWIKRVWAEVVDGDGVANTPDAARARDHVISTAIKAYYVQ